MCHAAPPSPGSFVVAVRRPPDWKLILVSPPRFAQSVLSTPPTETLRTQTQTRDRDNHDTTDQAQEDDFHYRHAAQHIELTEVKEAIVAGYYLHNLYNAFESIFRLVAETFENHIPDTSRWHTLLLDRMGRDIEGMRPRLLSDTALEALDELRRFRHLFRHLYRYNLDAEGVQKALRQAHRLQEVYSEDLEHFIAFLDSLTKTKTNDEIPG